MFHLENMNTTKQLRVTLDVSSRKHEYKKQNNSEFHLENIRVTLDVSSRKHEYNETTQSNIGCFI